MVSFGTPPPLKRGSGVLFFAAKKVLRKNGRLFWMLALRLIRSRNNRKRCNIFDCLQIRQFGVLLFRYDRRIYRPADDRIHQDFARRELFAVEGLGDDRFGELDVRGHVYAEGEAIGCYRDIPVAGF